MEKKMCSCTPLNSFRQVHSDIKYENNEVVIYGDLTVICPELTPETINVSKISKYQIGILQINLSFDV